MLDTLCTECLLIIFEQLPLEDLSRLSRTCKRLNAVSARAFAKQLETQTVPINKFPVCFPLHRYRDKIRHIKIDFIPFGRDPHGNQLKKQLSRISEKCPDIETLEIRTAHPSQILPYREMLRINEFSYLQDLFRSSRLHVIKCSARERVKRFPRFYEAFEEVADNCKKIKSLKLVGGFMDVALHYEYPQLRELRLSENLYINTPDSLFDFCQRHSSMKTLEIRVENSEFIVAILRLQDIENLSITIEAGVYDTPKAFKELATLASLKSLHINISSDDITDEILEYLLIRLPRLTEFRLFVKRGGWKITRGGLINILKVCPLLKKMHLEGDFSGYLKSFHLSEDIVNPNSIEVNIHENNGKILGICQNEKYCAISWKGAKG